MIRVDIVKIDEDSEHLRTVARGMRADDRAEMNALGLRGAYNQLCRSTRMSHEAFAGTVDGVAVCAFGIGIGNALCGIALPWLIATDELDDYRVAFLRRNRAIVADWRERFPVLENYVFADNTKAIRWLEFLGFAIEPAMPFGIYAEPFHRFHIERQAQPFLEVA